MRGRESVHTVLTAVVCLASARGSYLGLPRGAAGPWGCPLEEGATSCPPFLCSVGGTGGWSAKGCELLSRNRTHVACRCSLTTSFAVLMDVSRREVGVAPWAALPLWQVCPGMNPFSKLASPNIVSPR